MKKAILFTLAWLLSSITAAEDAQHDMFRVEVIVFTHAQGTPTLRPIDTLPVYTAAMDPNPDAQRTRPRDLTGRAGLPDQYTAQSTLSASMDGVWRQLQQSPLYTPVAWRSWYQHAAVGQSTRTVWIHDDQALSPNDGGLRLGSEHYRLEGTITHSQDPVHWLALDISWREAGESGLRAHGVRQGRSIRPDRLEYFDDPWLSASVWGTPWQPEE
jgi:hypothetical protein